MLPKANKNTFLVTVDMPAGTSLNHTDRLVHELEDRLLQHPEVLALVTTVGTGSVMDFNGLLRGTSFRNDPAQADIRVDLTKKEERSISSEAMVLALRPELQALGDKYQAHHQTRRGSRRARRCAPRSWPRSTARTASSSGRRCARCMACSPPPTRSSTSMIQCAHRRSKCA